MARPIAANTYVVPNATVLPTITSLHADPTVGGGVAAPLGSILLRTDAPSLYIKTGGANTAWTKLVAENQNLRATDYTATGLEGSDFSVAISGAALPTDVYELYWAPKGVAQIPVVDLPDTLVGDRTTTTFRVITSANLTAGDILSFLIFQT